METKAQVTKAITKVKKQLEADYPGSVWEVEVWHNLWWCAAVRCGTIGVYYHSYASGTSYSMCCDSQIGRASGTPIEWSLRQSVTKIEDIKIMITKQIARIKEDIKEREVILNHNLEQLKLS